LTIEGEIKMKNELKEKFPAFVRLDSTYNVEYSWEVKEKTQALIKNSLIEKELTAEKRLETEDGIFSLHQFAGSSKLLKP